MSNQVFHQDESGAHAAKSKQDTEQFRSATKNMLRQIDTGHSTEYEAGKGDQVKYQGCGL